MKKTLFVFMLLGVFLFVPSAAVNAQDEVLTNQDIISMTKAGLDQNIVINKIRASNAKFDLSTNGLIELKKESVPDPIVHAMLEATSRPKQGPAVPTTGPAPMDPNDPAAPHDFGIYLYEDKDGNRLMTRIDPNVSAQNRTGGKVTAAIVPFGLGKVKQKANLAGTAAKMQVKDSQPVFYFYLDNKSGGLNTMSGIPATPSEFSLVKFNIRDDNREITISKSNSWGAKGGLSDESVMPLTAESLGNGIFKVTPSVPLKLGEYGFYLVNSGNSNTASGIGSKFFDFGVRVLP